MSDTPRTDSEVEIFNDEYTGFKDAGYVSETFARQLERELSAANARIAELEEAIINANDGLLDGEGVPLTYYMRNGKYKDLIASVTAPSQPTILPE